MQRLGGGNECRENEQRPLWLELIGRCGERGWKGDGRDQTDHDLLGHGKEFRFYSPWTGEPLQDLEWKATRSDF